MSKGPGLRLRVVPAAALLCAVAASACTGDDRPIVTTEAVTSGEVTQSVSAPATVAPAAQQDVAAAISGVVLAIRTEDGGKVRRGETVLRLASAQVDLAQRQARAAQRAAASVAGVNLEGNGGATLAATHEAVARLDATTQPRLERARRRAHDIADDDQRAAALAAVEAVNTSYRVTREALLATGQALATQQDTTAAALSQALNQAVASATAGQRAQAQAAAEFAERQSDELRVTAPFRGTVEFGQAAAADGVPLPPDVPAELAGIAGSLGGLTGGEGGGTLRVGAPVVAGQTLFTVYDLSSVYVTADIDEIDAPTTKAGQRATVLVDAFPDVPLEGVVEHIAVAAAPTAAGGVGYPARIRLLGPSDADDTLPLRKLRIGMTASADISTLTESSSLVIPSRALLRREDRSVVFVVRDGQAVEVEVEVLALGEEQAAVAAELTPQDRIVVTGYEDLEDGDEVVAD